MTERMQNALRHIETSCDVDQWAIDTVREVFEEYSKMKEEKENGKV